VHENEKNDFFGFPKVKCLHVTGEVDKSVRCSCQIFFHDSMYQESLKSVNFDRLVQKIKRWTFFGTQCIKPNIGPAFVLYNTLYLPNPPHSFLLFPPTPSIAGRRFFPKLDRVPFSPLHTVPLLTCLFLFFVPLLVPFPFSLLHFGGVYLVRIKIALDYRASYK